MGQTSGAGNPTYGAGQKSSSDTTGSSTGASSTDTTRRNQKQPTTATGSGYHSGSASADADAAREINAQTRAATRDKLSWGDRRFVNKAADDGQSELQIAQLAAQRATNAEVRSFAQKLVDDHTKVNSELMALASQESVDIDTDDDKDRAYKRLNKKSGMEFDQEFVEHMIDEHEKDIKMFEKASSDAKDAEVRSFASRHVGSLREHLHQAQNLRQTLTPTGRMNDASGRSSPGGATGAGTSGSSSDRSSTGATGSTSGAPGSQYGTGSGSSGTDPKRREGSR
jgi:putative membrane protein